MNVNYNEHKKNITVLDIVLLSIICIFSIVLFVFVAQNTEGTMQVKITTEQGDFIYPLNKDKNLAFEGPVGTTSIKIFDSKVDVLQSPGRKQICVNAKYIEKNGQWLACLPNKVFLRILGGEQNRTNSPNADIDGMAF